MEFKITQQGEVQVVHLLGDKLNAANSKVFRDALAPTFSAGGKFVLDLQNLGFMDSSGIGALLSCLRQANEAKGDIKLCNVQKPVQILFQLVRMNRVFDIHSTVTLAVEAYQNGTQ